MARVTMVYAADAGYSFTWYCGPYIDVSVHCIEGGYGPTCDVVNVWDYEADTPRIPATQEAFRAECDAYIARMHEEEGN